MNLKEEVSESELVTNKAGIRNKTLTNGIYKFQAKKSRKEAASLITELWLDFQRRERGAF
jgi:hypothetical protein